MNNNKKQNIKKAFPEKPHSDIVRFGKDFVDSFIFEDKKAVDIPLAAIRAIFTIAGQLRSEQLVPDEQPKQLQLFEENFQNEHNTYASMKIKNRDVSPSGSSKQVLDAFEYLVKYKQEWQTSINSKGNEIRTFGGLILAPNYDERGYTSFLISSYWLRKLIVIPEYNSHLYNLVYNVVSNTQVIFALWLETIPLDGGTTIKLENINKKFGINYSDTKSLCDAFLTPIKKKLDKINKTSFNFSRKEDKISIKPYANKIVEDPSLKEATQKSIAMRQRMSYIRDRHRLNPTQVSQIATPYDNKINAALIEAGYKSFITNCRRIKAKATAYQGADFLKALQEHIVHIYRQTPTGKANPTGCLRIDK